MTTEIDRLLELPVGRFLADDLILDSLQAGGSTMRTLLIVNDGKSSLTVQGASTDIEGLRVTLPGQTIAAGDTASIVLTYEPLLEGNFSGHIRVETPGGISDEIFLPVEIPIVLPLQMPEVFTTVESINLGE